jgi:hypothetical protein
VAKRPHTNDLFELFPDLPWTRPSVSNARRAQVLRQVEDTRVWADLSVRRQKAANERAREIFSPPRRR